MPYENKTNVRMLPALSALVAGVVIVGGGGWYFLKPDTSVAPAPSSTPSVTMTPLNPGTDYVLQCEVTEVNGDFIKVKTWADNTWNGEPCDNLQFYIKQGCPGRLVGDILWISFVAGIRNQGYIVADECDLLIPASENTAFPTPSAVSSTPSAAPSTPTNKTTSVRVVYVQNYDNRTGKITVLDGIKVVDLNTIVQKGDEIRVTHTSNTPTPPAQKK